MAAETEPVEAKDLGSTQVESSSRPAPEQKLKSWLTGDQQPVDCRPENDDPNFAKRKGAFADLWNDKDFEDLNEDYKVENFYFETGWAQWWARSEPFLFTTLAVIFANVVYIGVDIDNNTAITLSDAHVGFRFCEYFFCCFFAAELMVRYLAFEQKTNCLLDAWFRFDLALVVLNVLDIMILPLVFLTTGIDGKDVPTAPMKLLRLLRLPRLIRLVRFVPELLTFVKGIFVASRAVLSSLVMVGLLIYVFAMIIFMVLRDHSGLKSSGYFDSLGMCMWTLLLDGTLLDNSGELLNMLLETGDGLSVFGIIIFFVFMMLSAMTILNMLIGILTEVVGTVKQMEQDEADLKLMKQTIFQELTTFDRNSNGLISGVEMDHVMASNHALSMFKHLSIDVAYVKGVQQMLFPDELSEVPIQRLMEFLMTTRGSLTATVRHLDNSNAFTRWYLENQIRGLELRLRRSLSMRFATEASEQLESDGGPREEEILTLSKPMLDI